MPSFNPDGTRRLARTVRKSERDPGPGRRSRSGTPRGSRPRWFRTTSAFAAATDTGSTVTLKYGTGKMLGGARPSGTADATLTDQGRADMPIYNGLNGTIASGKLVLCVYVGGIWVIDLVWCG